jgi:hypothetical protein
MKLTRLFQPRNPLFWIMFALNALSSVLTFMLHTRDMATPAKLLIASFALANAVLGMWLAWRLMRDPPVGEKVGKRST